MKKKDIEFTVDQILNNIRVVNFEIILINDFSSDNTKNVFKKISLKSEKLKFMKTLKV